MKTLNKPYFYLIKHTESGKYYAGCQHGETANKSNFWVKYFTSSKLVKNIIKNDGIESFEVCVLIERFDAYEFEHEFLTSVSAAKSDDWINQSNGRGHFHCQGHTDETRLKMSNSRTGKSRDKFSADHKAKISVALTGRKLSHETRSKQSKSKTGMKYKEMSDVGKLNISISKKGKPSPKKGMKLKPHSAETKMKMSLSHKNRGKEGKQPLMSCIYCRKIGGAKSMFSRHLSKCSIHEVNSNAT